MTASNSSQERNMQVIPVLNNKIVQIISFKFSIETGYRADLQDLPSVFDWQRFFWQLL